MAVISNGTTLIDNGALDAGVPAGSLILLSTQTASASATIDFTSGINSTYDSYVFKFINIHPATNSVQFQFNISTDGGSNYNVTKTSTAFVALNYETGGTGSLEWENIASLAQSTSDQVLALALGNGNDDSYSGTLQIYNPSSTTFVKHFVSKGNQTSVYDVFDWTINYFIGGYGNTTSSVNAVRFQMSSGNIDDGIIKMYGVK